MNASYKKVCKAKTLDDLIMVLTEWKIEGYDMSAEWNGFDDGRIYCHPKDQEWRAIESDTF